MKNILYWLNIYFLLSACSSKNGEVNTGHIKNKWLNIPYSFISEAQKLDIYIPDTNKIHPVIIFIHGGAFMGGDKADFQLNPALEGLKKGYAIVSINYRLSQESTFPAQIHDVKAAIRWVKANASKYHFNASKIILWGASAGGHLASLAGTSADIKALEDLNLGHADESSSVQVVIDWFAPINFLEIDNQLTKSGLGEANHSDENSFESKLMGQKITDIPAQIKAANPEIYISINSPYFLIQHGSLDYLIPVEQSITFAEKLQRVLGNEKVKLTILNGASHGGKEFESAENLNLIFQFLDNKIK